MPKFYKQGILSKKSKPEVVEGMEEPASFNPLETLIEWKSLSRPYRKKDRSFYTTIIILIILFSFVASWIAGWTAVLALIAMGFAVFVFNMVPPQEITNKMTNQGVTIGDHFYHWQELSSFWVEENDGYTILNIATRLRFPGVLMIIIEPEQVEKIKLICARFLPFNEIVPKTFIDRWSDRLQKYFPLEKR